MLFSVAGHLYVKNRHTDDFLKNYGDAAGRRRLTHKTKHLFRCFSVRTLNLGCFKTSLTSSFKELNSSDVTTSCFCYSSLHPIYDVG